jgi:hypothetical protein
VRSDQNTSGGRGSAVGPHQGAGGEFHQLCPCGRLVGVGNFGCKLMIAFDASLKFKIEWTVVGRFACDAELPPDLCSSCLPHRVDRHEARHHVCRRCRPTLSPWTAPDCSAVQTVPLFLDALGRSFMLSVITTQGASRGTDRGPLSNFLKNFLDAPLVGSTLHQEIEDVVVLIHRPPQVLACPC